MSMHGSYDEYGQNETADLVRSVALSSAKLWEEVFDRLRRLEDAQVELREMLGRIEGQLPVGAANAALTSGPPSALSWPERAIAPADPTAGDREPARTDLFVPGPVNDSTAADEHVAPRDAFDLLGVSTSGPVGPEPVDDEPATFFFPPADESPRLGDSVPGGATAGWTGSELIGTSGWTSPPTVRYDEGFTSTDVVGPPTEEVQAIDMTPAEHDNSEYFGRHAAGPPPGFAVANGDGAPAPMVGLEPEVPQVHVSDAENTYDPVIDEQLQQAAQAVEMHTGTVAGPASLEPPRFGFGSGTEVGVQGAPEFEAWNEDAARVPLVYAPGDGPAPAPDADEAAASPSGVGLGATGYVPAPPPAPVGFGTVGDEWAPPPPPPGFATKGEVPAPPPPPPGFATPDDVPPPPPGFGTVGDEWAPPPPPPGFATPDDVPPPPPPPGFGALGEKMAPPAAPAPSGFTSGADLAEAGFATVAPPPPPPGFGLNGGVGDGPPTPPPPGFSLPAGGPAVTPPPPPGFSFGSNGGNGAPAGPVRPPTVSGSIADDLRAISSMTPPADAATDQGEDGTGNGHGAGDDGPPPPITPDFFARAGRRRR